MFCRPTFLIFTLYGVGSTISEECVGSDHGSSNQEDAREDANSADDSACLSSDVTWGRQSWM